MLSPIFTRMSAVPGDGIGNQVFVDVEPPFLVVGRRRREPRRNLHCVDREGQGPG